MITIQNSNIDRRHQQQQQYKSLLAIMWRASDLLHSMYTLCNNVYRVGQKLFVFFVHALPKMVNKDEYTKVCTLE